MSKPIIKKPVNASAVSMELHPEMKRSDVSLGLEALSSEQQNKLDNLSPNAKKLLTAMCDSDRYEKLIDPDYGYIVLTEGEIESVCKQVMAIDEQVGDWLDVKIPIEPVGMSEEARQIWAISSASESAANACRFRREAINAASKAAKLAKLVADLSKMRIEAEVLEKKIVDDANLPDFAALGSERVDAGFAKAEVSAADLAKQAGAAVIDITGSKGDTAQGSILQDCPIKWTYRYKASGDVWAPSEEGAQAMVALKIKRQVVAEDICVAKES